MAVPVLDPNGPGGDGLAAALAAGPFHEALRLAIQRRGLSLHRVHGALVARGAEISIPALSHWQRGRSQPERPESLRAVAALEDVLDIPAGTLRALLGPPRARGRRLKLAAGVPLDRLWEPEYDVVDRLLDDLGTRPDEGLAQVSRYEECFVNERGELVVSRHRQVVRAEAPRVDRCVQVQRLEDIDPETPTFRDARHCRIGRRRADGRAGVAVAEMILDRVLEHGELTSISYEVEFPPSRTPLDSLDRRFMSGIREYVLQLNFHPAAVPARCFQLTRRCSAGTRPELREIWLGPSHTAEIVVLDGAPGIHGIQVEWE